MYSFTVNGESPLFNFELSEIPNLISYVKFTSSKSEIIAVPGIIGTLIPLFILNVGGLDEKTEGTSFTFVDIITCIVLPSSPCFCEKTEFPLEFN